MNIIKKKILVKKINKALGIELTKWQIDYIFGDYLPSGMHLSTRERLNGLTTAQCLRLLFRSDYNGLLIDVRPLSILSYYAKTDNLISHYDVLNQIDIFGDDAVSLKRQEHFIQCCDKIIVKLTDAGIKTNRVSLSMKRRFLRK